MDRHQQKEPHEQVVGSPLQEDSTIPVHQVAARQGIGLAIPQRNVDHADPGWYEQDLDELESLDDPGIDPLPTERHRKVVPK